MSFCRNPDCSGTEFDEVELSRTGRIWSYTNACYEPPEPFVAPKPFEPFAIAAVELELEKMIVLGQVVRGVGAESLEVGMPMELVLETLYRDGDTEKLIWKWKPACGASPTPRPPRTSLEPSPGSPRVAFTVALWAEGMSTASDPTTSVSWVTTRVPRAGIRSRC